MEIFEANKAKSSEDGPSLQALRDLLTSTAKLVNTRATEQQRKEIIALDEDIAGITLMEMPDAQFLEPRGRYPHQGEQHGHYLGGQDCVYLYILGPCDPYCCYSCPPKH